MDEAQVELTPEEEARIKWEQLLRGKPTVVEPTPIEEVVEATVKPTIVLRPVIDNSDEAVLARLHKSMKKI